MRGERSSDSAAVILGPKRRHRDVAAGRRGTLPPRRARSGTPASTARAPPQSAAARSSTRCTETLASILREATRTRGRATPAAHRRRRRQPARSPRRAECPTARAHAPLGEGAGLDRSRRPAAMRRRGSGAATTQRSPANTIEHRGAPIKRTRRRFHLEDRSSACVESGCRCTGRPTRRRHRPAPAARCRSPIAARRRARLSQRLSMSTRQRRRSTSASAAGSTARGTCRVVSPASTASVPSRIAAPTRSEPPFPRSVAGQPAPTSRTSAAASGRRAATASDESEHESEDSREDDTAHLRMHARVERGPDVVEVEEAVRKTVADRPGRGARDAAATRRRQLRPLRRA